MAVICDDPLQEWTRGLLQWLKQAEIPCRELPAKSGDRFRHLLFCLEDPLMLELALPAAPTAHWITLSCMIAACPNQQRLLMADLLAGLNASCAAGSFQLAAGEVRYICRLPLHQPEPRFSSASFLDLLADCKEDIYTHARRITDLARGRILPQQLNDSLQELTGLSMMLGRKEEELCCRQKPTSKS